MPRMITIDAEPIEESLRKLDAGIGIAVKHLRQGAAPFEDSGILSGDTSPGQGDIIPVADYSSAFLLGDGQLAPDHLDDEALPSLGREGAEISEPRSFLWLLNYLTISEWGVRQFGID